MIHTSQLSYLYFSLQQCPMTGHQYYAYHGVVASIHMYTQLP